MTEQPTDWQNQNWLTQEAYDRLKAEYDERQGSIRETIVARIQAAREEGDLRENGGYHAAKDEQGKNEARIRQLRQILETAQIGTAPVSDGLIAPGQLVTVRFAGAADTDTFLLGSREAAATADVDVYSPTSPLGAALVGAKVGDSVTYQTPAGKSMTVTIESAEPYAG